MQGSESVKQICERFNITQQQLYKQARDKEWPLRSQQKQAPAKSHKHNVHANVEHLNIKHRRKEMIARLYDVLDQKLNIIEERLVMPNDIEGAENERQARTLASLIRLFDKLVEIEADEANSQKNNKSQQEVAEDIDDTERLREDLAKRLTRLQGGSD